MRSGRAGNADMAILERLPKNLKRLPGEFGEFVKEQHAAMSKRNFTGHRLCSAAKKPYRAYGMVRSAKRTSRHKPSTAFRDSSHRMYARDLKSLIHAQGREY